MVVCIQASNSAAIHSHVDDGHFVHALFTIQDQLAVILRQADRSESVSVSYDPGTLHFGMFPGAIQQLQEQNALLPAIKQRRIELLEQKEHWRSFVTDFVDIGQGQLLAAPAGSGGAYFLTGTNGTVRYVIKPVDEDALCLNNRKEGGSPFNDLKHRVREHIPLYRSAQTDAFCYELARLAKIEGITPKAVLGIVRSEEFYDITQWLEESEEFIALTGRPDKEKLCSIQEFIPETRDLSALLKELYSQGFSNEEIGMMFDREEIEQVFLLIWLIYDNDAHKGNFLTYVKQNDGKIVYGIKKIDNSLSIPEKNTHYSNILSWIPASLFPVSDELKDKIAHLPVKEILERMDEYGLSACKEAMVERIELLQTLAQNEEVTLGEIDVRMSFLSKENGKNLALSDLSTQEILELIKGREVLSEEKN